MCVFVGACVSLVRCLDVQIASYRPVSFAHTVHLSIINYGCCCSCGCCHYRVPSHVITLHGHYYRNSFHVYLQPAYSLVNTCSRKSGQYMQACMTCYLWRPMSVVLIVCMWPFVLCNGKRTQNALPLPFSTVFSLIGRYMCVGICEHKSSLYGVVSSPFLAF